MTATLGWLDHDPEERERMNRVLALFQENDARDELGLGPIRESIADLRHEWIDDDQVFGPFEVLLPLFIEATYEAYKLVVVDEGHYVESSVRAGGFQRKDSMTLQGGRA